MTLDEQYQKTIDDQRAYLLKLQEVFNKACDDAKAEAQEALKNTSPEDKEAREAVLESQKVKLDAALHHLKNEVDHSTREVMRKLEEIVSEKEKTILEELEQELDTL